MSNFEMPVGLGMALAMNPEAMKKILISDRTAEMGSSKRYSRDTVAERNAAVRPQYNRGILKRGAAHRCSFVMVYCRILPLVQQ